MITKRQRIILNVLTGLKTHPTVDGLYILVKKHLPTISLSTLYRNLNVLAAKKKILKLEQFDKMAHFDADILPHSHFRCEKCGRVYDIPTQAAEENLQAVKKIRGHRITGYQVAFFGICETCKQNKQEKKK